MSQLKGNPAGEGKRFALAVSRFNELVTQELEEGARACLRDHGVAESDIDTAWVPGAWELPPVAKRLALSGRYAGIVALGCVIRGETPHFDFVAGEAARGLADVASVSPVPVTFGLLTTDTLEQAMARAGGKGGNKGRDAAVSALEMADLYPRLEGMREEP